MDLKHDEPKISMDVHRRTTQLNLWIIAAVVIFFLAGGFFILRLMQDPPDSTEEMQNSAHPLKRYAWVARTC